MMSFKSLATAALLLVSATAWTAALAGFPHFSNPMSQSSSSGGNAGAMQDALLKHFVAGQVGVVKAQSSMAAAVGLKDEATKLSTEAEAINSGATQDNLSTAMADSTEAQQLIESKTSSSTQLSSDAKKQFGGALVDYATGLAALRKLGPDYSNFTKAANQEISSAGPMSTVQTKNKLQVGLYVATNAPGYVANLAKASADLIKFASSNGISVPKDATDALSGP